MLARPAGASEGFPDGSRTSPHYLRGRRASVTRVACRMPCGGRGGLVPWGQFTDAVKVLGWNTGVSSDSEADVGLES